MSAKETTGNFEAALYIRAGEDNMSCEVLEVEKTSSEYLAQVDTSTDQGKQDFIRSLLTKTAAHWANKKIQELLAKEGIVGSLEVMLKELGFNEEGKGE